MIALLFTLAALQGPAADRTIAGVPYERLETREATRDTMLAKLMRTDMSWGDWYLLSPFPYAGHDQDDLRTPHPPEDELLALGPGDAGPDLERTWIGKYGVEARWRPLGRIEDTIVELRVHGDDALDYDATCYLWGTIELGAARSVDMTMGSDDGLRVWLDGRLVHDLDVARGLDPESDRVRFDFHEGVNHVVVKVSNGAGGWGFQINAANKLDPLVDAQLQYWLDRDFPPSPERRAWRATTVPVPEDVVLEVGGLALLGDGRPVVTTRRGDVFLVEGAYAEPPTQATFTRFATGLHEPLGAAVRADADGEAVYAVQRGELTRLVDVDGDDRADLYETFCDDWGVSGNYHEFAFGPKFDAEGNAWVSLNVGFCGSLGKSIVPYRGWALKITPDGERIAVCGGLRSPNGFGEYEGEMFYVDNQGDWVATNKLAHLAPGSWHGHPSSLRWYEEHEEGDAPPPVQPPAVWFPYRKMGQSTADVVRDETGGAFGPFAGQLLVGDQMHASVMRVDLEQVNGHWQGACFPFLEQLDCGVNRLVFAPDGSLFVGQTDRGWGSLGRKRYGLQRVVWTGETPFALRTMRARENGFVLSFTADVDAASALDPASYRMTSYTYEHHADYGAPEDDTLELELVPTLVGPREVHLAVSPLRAGHVHELHASVRSAAGEELMHGRAYYTLVEVPGSGGSPQTPRVLFLTRSAGFSHPVVTRSGDALALAEEQLVDAAKGRFVVDATQDVGAISAENLARYDAVAFYTTGELPIPDEGRDALFDFVRRGGGFVGIHSATDTWYEEPRYVELIGGSFDGHPWHQKVAVRVERGAHPATAHLGAVFEITDEIYQHRAFSRERVHVLLSLDPSSVEIERGKRSDGDYALAWCREYGDGRVFYTALGHRPTVWRDARFLRHVLGALEWATGGADWSPPAPEGAVVLFDGSKELGTSAWRHRDGSDARWTLGGGGFEVEPGKGDLLSRESFGDFRMHLEFRLPAFTESGHAANSGVYLQDRYEVQILDSRAAEPPGTADCGALYDLVPPATNAARAPQEWQSFDVFFRAARWNPDGTRAEPARVTLYHNGLLVHDDVAISSSTGGGQPEESSPGPIRLQDHGDRVRFRNVWIVPQ